MRGGAGYVSQGAADHNMNSSSFRESSRRMASVEGQAPLRLNSAHADPLQFTDTNGAAQQALEKQARLLDLAHDAIIVRDFNGSITYWNEGAVKMYGWTKEEAIGKIAQDLLRTEFPESLEEVRNTLLAEGHWEGELVHTARNGTRITVASRQVLERMLKNPDRPPVVLEMNRDITELKEIERRLHESELALREFSGYLVQSQDEERWRISRDLHDSISQNLTGLLTRLHILARVAHALDEPTRKALAESVKLAEGAASYTRVLASGLYPTVLDEQGLGAAIRWYADGIAAQSTIRVELESLGKQSRLPRQAERSLYRIAQESITRIRLLSSGTRVRIRLAQAPNEFVLEVRDGGGKIPVTVSASREPGIRGLDVGLTLMHERMRQLGGRLEISSSDSGTLIRAVLPLDEIAAATPASSV
jgi:PAS domain S-box-containing protein